MSSSNVNRIADISCRAVLDATGHYGVEVDVTVGWGIVRSQARVSCAPDPDNDSDRTYYNSVISAIDTFDTSLKPRLVGAPLTESRAIDSVLDTSTQASPMPPQIAALTRSISTAVWRGRASGSNRPLYRLLAEEMKTPTIRLPTPIVSVLGGGAVADSELGFAQILIFPLRTTSFKDALESVVTVHQSISKVLKSEFGVGGVTVADDGSFAAPLRDVEDAIRIVETALDNSGKIFEMGIGINCGASHLWDAAKEEYDTKWNWRKPEKESVDEEEPQQPTEEDVEHETEEPSTDQPPLSSGRMHSARSESRSTPGLENPPSARPLSPKTSYTPLEWTDLLISLIERHRILYLEHTHILEHDQELKRLFGYCSTHNVLLAQSRPILEAFGEIESVLPLSLSTSLSEANTLTDLISLSADLQLTGHAVIVDCTMQKITETVSADVAVGTGSGLIKLSLARGENIEVVNQLLRVEEEMKGLAVYGFDLWRVVEKTQNELKAEFDESERIRKEEIRRRKEEEERARREEEERAAEEERRRVEAEEAAAAAAMAAEEQPEELPDEE
ncbi:Enolase [Blattamonas nauphoetae]|uniref:phosphopyruvate hydratase n=1 Tax=Blattamonas nauphoetae TaxID=2049346 RepID=A0ABQ9YD06_9EUKA|nr:Enolase [Blattamonas nauphoetae]